MTIWLVPILFITIIGAVIIAFSPDILGGTTRTETRPALSATDTPNFPLLQTEPPQNQESKIIWSYLFNPINISTDFDYDIHRFFFHNNAFYSTQSDNYYYYPTGYALDIDSVYFPSELTNIVSVDLQSGNLN